MTEGMYSGEAGSASSRVKDQASAVAAQARRSLDDIDQRYHLRDRVEEHPFAAVGVALAAGYVLGGGLFTKLTGRLLVNGVRLGLRLAALPLIRDELATLSRGVSGQSTGSSVVE